LAFRIREAQLLLYERIIEADFGGILRRIAVINLGYPDIPAQ
jgi:hypothetical protein